MKKIYLILEKGDSTTRFTNFPAFENIETARYTLTSEAERKMADPRLEVNFENDVLTVESNHGYNVYFIEEMKLLSNLDENVDNQENPLMARKNELLKYKREYKDKLDDVMDELNHIEEIEKDDAEMLQIKNN